MKTMCQAPPPSPGRARDREQILACAGRTGRAFQQPAGNAVETRASTRPEAHQSQGSGQSLRRRSPLLEPTTENPSSVQWGQGRALAQTTGEMSLVWVALS